MSIFMKKFDEKTIRKAKTVNRKRAERLSLALTEEEKNLINKGAAKAGLSRTDFILKAVRNERIIVITGLPEVYRALYRAGNNLNQIAKQLNGHSYVNPKTIQNTIQECRDTYKTLMRFIDHWKIRISETEENDDCENESQQEH